MREANSDNPAEQGVRADNERADENRDLGLSILIAEDEDGSYEPVAGVWTIAEARELAQGDMRTRIRRLDSDGSPMCPATYKVWARNGDGDYNVIAELSPQ